MNSSCGSLPADIAIEIIVISHWEMMERDFVNGGNTKLSQSLHLDPCCHGFDVVV
jgi:hypothetical protein